MFIICNATRAMRRGCPPCVCVAVTSIGDAARLGSGRGGALRWRPCGLLSAGICYPAFDAYSNMWNTAARWYQGRHQGEPGGVRGPRGVHSPLTGCDEVRPGGPGVQIFSLWRGPDPLCQESPFWGLAVDPRRHRYPAGGAYPGLAGALVRPGYRPRAGEG